jgi:hypothetical protein
VRTLMKKPAISLILASLNLLLIGLYALPVGGKLDAVAGAVRATSSCRMSVGTSIFLRSSVKSVSENALIHPSSPAATSAGGFLSNFYDENARTRRTGYRFAAEIT